MKIAIPTQAHPIDLKSVSCQVNGVSLDRGERVIDFSATLSLDDIRDAVHRLTTEYQYDYFCPTIITTSMEVYRHNLRLFAEAMKCEWGAPILGVHLEGPVLNRSCIGAHPV